MTPKERYKIFCDTQPAVPLFLQAWWMEAVCVDKAWDVFLYEEKEEILAVFVFHFIKKMGFKCIVNPQLTQFNGLWINYPNNISTQKKLSLDKKIMNYFVQQLAAENFALYEQSFHHSITNWQPLYWKGFEQTTRYTFKINDLTNLDAVFQSFTYTKQNLINKPDASFFIDFALSADELYALKALEQQEEKVVYSDAFLRSIYAAATERNQGQIIGIKDHANVLHAAIFVVWDKHCAYYLISAINPKFRSDGCSAKMVWEAIKFVADKTQTFDFEGSMIEGVAWAYQQFGAEQIPYFKINKCNSLIINALMNLKKHLKL